MKNIVLSLLFLLATGMGSSHVHAQKTKVKVKDSSQKKKPSWANGLEKGYIITMASDANLEKAQEKALAKVKEQVISAVAENIQTSTEYYRSEDIKNNETVFEETFKTNTQTRAADIPFIKGISASKVDAYYWEKLETNKVISYNYHVKYGFSAIQLKKLIQEYEAADRALTKELEASIEKIDQAKSVEEVLASIKELEALEDSFIDVDTRKSKAKVAIANAKSLLKNLSIETVSETLGQLKLTLSSGDRVYSSNRKPTVKSNCAKITTIKNNKDYWLIEYNYDQCYEDPDNKIFVEFKNSFGRAKHEYYFDVNAEKIEFFVNGDINLSAEQASNSIKMQIPLFAKYPNAFTIDKVILKFGKESPIIVENINLKFEGKGEHFLEIEGLVNSIENYSAKKYSMVHGSIHYSSVKSGEKGVIKLFNQSITSNR